MQRFLGTSPEWKALEVLAAHWDFWPLAEVKKTLQSQPALICYLRSEETSQWQMSAFAFCLLDTEAELLYLFVDEPYRGKGLAKGLLLGTMKELRNQYASRAIHLEVRASNQTALAVYASCGFSLLGRRRRYYQDGEDALLMRCRLLPDTPLGSADRDMGS